MPASSTLDEFGVMPSLSEATKSSFRISVCLKRYFTDIRALCFVLIIRKKSVKWLERKIQKLFDLSGRFYLITNGHLLPSSERLGLLNPDDVVEVIPHEISQLSQQPTQLKEGPCSLNNNLNVTEKNIPNKTKENIGPFSKCTSSQNPDQLYIEKTVESHKHFDIEENVPQIVISNKILKSNDQKETQDDDTLERVKQNALSLLDTRYGITADLNQPANDTVIPRKRKRVRRKRQLTASSQTTLNLSVDSTASTHETLNNITEDFSNTYSVNHEGDTCNSEENTSTLIARNGESCGRKPRVVKSIIDS